MCVYISDRRASHGPRIKFMDGYGDVAPEFLVTMTVSSQPEIIGEIKNLKTKDLKLLKEWVLLNLDILLDLYNGKFDEIEAAIQLRRI